MQATKQANWKPLFFLSLTALGVVYGDIGTSPLYAINEIFFGHGEMAIAPSTILGAISLVFWALTLVVTCKYIIFVLRADNDGEGGVFALSALLNQINTNRLALITVISSLLIFAAGLLFGDGIITPAISVISAVEGLKVATPFFEPYIVPITLVILTGLFLIQSKGTTKVGAIFGPIIIIWFLTIAGLGLIQILHTPVILYALHPFYALNFLTSQSLYRTLLVLGSVMLVITGGEAMYADMGHFGRTPIRISWFSLVYPALLLNYFGQGAFLLSGQAVRQGNIFYSLVPPFLLYPMVILATLATIIASQALISGAFSIATQAIELGLFPLLKIVHTHEEHEGQRYVPFINWSLYLGYILLVLRFQSSTRLASVYGLSVSGAMLIDSLAMIIIARYVWHWNKFKALGLFSFFALIDLTFLTANSLKLLEGGYIPLLIALFLLLLMKTWSWGRSKVRAAFAAYPAMTINELIELKKKVKTLLPRSVIIMTPEPILEQTDKVPPLEQLYWERYGTLSKHIIFLHVNIQKIPYARQNRYEVAKFFEDKNLGSIVSVIVNFGFMEDPNIEKIVEGLASHEEINIEHDPKDWVFRIIQEKILPGPHLHGIKRWAFRFYKFLQKNSSTADEFFGLGREVGLSTEVMPVVIS